MPQILAYIIFTFLGIASGCSMKHIQIINTIWRRRQILFITVGVAMAVIILGTLLTTRVYTASIVLRVATASGGTVSFTDYPYADTLLNTSLNIITSEPVKQAIRQQLGLTRDPQIEAEIIPNTELVKISVQAPDRQLAFNTVNTLASILQSRSAEFFSGSGKNSLDIINEQIQAVESELQSNRDAYNKLIAQNSQDGNKIAEVNQLIEVNQQIYTSLMTQYEQVRIRESIRENAITIVEPAVLPTRPSKPNIPLNLAIGLFASLAGGLGLVFLFEYLDQTLYSAEAIVEHSGLKLLGVIPKIKGVKEFSDSGYFESIQTIRTNINTAHTPFSMLITSSEQGEGKSTFVFHLSQAIAHEGKNVAVIDANLRAPMLHNLFELPIEPGLSEYLDGTAYLNEIIRESKNPNLQVITSGTPHDHPSVLLNSGKMQSLIKDLEKRFEIILIDSPIAHGIADVKIVAPAVNQILIIAKCGKVQEENLKLSVKQLSSIHANNLGIVVNEDDEFHHNYPYTS